MNGSACSSLTKVFGGSRTPVEPVSAPVCDPVPEKRGPERGSRLFPPV